MVPQTRANIKAATARTPARKYPTNGIHENNLMIGMKRQKCPITFMNRVMYLKHLVVHALPASKPSKISSLETSPTLTTSIVSSKTPLKQHSTMKHGKHQIGQETAIS
jgi:hypothetical protein